MRLVVQNKLIVVTDAHGNYVLLLQLFITHGGAGSLQEALCHKIPLVQYATDISVSWDCPFNNTIAFE